MEKNHECMDVVQSKWIQFKHSKGETQVLDLVPDHNRRLAIVDFDVLNRLTSYLPTSDHFVMKRNLRDRIMNTENLEELVSECEEFVAFHRSVNLIQEVYTELESHKDGEEVEPEEAEPELNPYEE